MAFLRLSENQPQPEAEKTDWSHWTKVIVVALVIVAIAVGALYLVGQYGD